MQYLTPENVLVIHAKLIDETGGLHGVRDLNLLISITERPKTSFGGQERYPTIFEKVATYLDGFVRYHVFIDGNKRTGIAASARFLFINGYEFSVSNEEMEKFVLEVAIKKLGIAEIVPWFEKHSSRKQKITNSRFPAS